MGDCDDESAACKKDRKDYDLAAAIRAASENDIAVWSRELAQAQKDLAASTGVVVAGVAVAGGAGWTGAGVLVGIGIGLVGAAGAGWSYYKYSNAKQQLADARAECEAARRKMDDARKAALSDCQNPNCVPPVVAPCP